MEVILEARTLVTLRLKSLLFDRNRCRCRYPKPPRYHRFCETLSAFSFIEKDKKGGKKRNEKMMRLSEKKESF